jgi:hypothetical protein
VIFLFVEKLQGLFCRRHIVNFVVVAPEDVHKGIAYNLLIVNNQNPFLVCRCHTLTDVQMLVHDLPQVLDPERLAEEGRARGLQELLIWKS